MIRATAIIPARYASTRYPGKPLLNQTGRFLIQHVCEQVRRATLIEQCIVATDDERIATAVRSFGGLVAMTRADHPSGTDRIAEVVHGLRDGPGSRLDDIILNVQGDEPEIEPANLDRLVERLAADTACPVGTLACPFPAEADPRDPNCVKVVVNSAGRALYFSRALIPYPRDGQGAGPGAGSAADGHGSENCGTMGRTPPRSGSFSHLLHLGVYAYRRQFLLEFASWPQGRLEQIEKLEQLRVLENGYGMAVEIVATAAPGIDTPADYEAFVRRWAKSTDRPYN